MYGLVKDPDLYKCGVNWVGVTDVKLLFTVSWSDMRGPVMENMGTLMHGNPKTDEAYFQKVSAIDNAQRIKAPVLMAYGSEDIRVPLIHGEKMRDKLIKNGNTVEWLVMTGEGHGWAKESNNILWGQTVVSFIDKYIGDAAKVEVSPLQIGIDADGKHFFDPVIAQAHCRDLFDRGCRFYRSG